MKVLKHKQIIFCRGKIWFIYLRFPLQTKIICLRFKTFINLSHTLVNLFLRPAPLHYIYIYIPARFVSLTLTISLDRCQMKNFGEKWHYFCYQTRFYNYRKSLIYLLVSIQVSLKWNVHSHQQAGVDWLICLVFWKPVFNPWVLILQFNPSSNPTLNLNSKQ